MPDPTYEQNLAELRRCVDQLENGKLTLEQSLDVHARATEVSGRAAQQLVEAEKRLAEANKK